MTNAATTTGSSTIPSGTTTGTATGERWVGISEAVGLLGLSERSVRRAVATGKLVSAMQGGRRVVRIQLAPDPVTGTPEHRHPTGGQLVELKPDATGTTGGEQAVVRQALAAVIEQHQGELRRARRAAGWGWSIAAAAGILLAVGAVWGVRAIGQADRRAAAAEAVAGIQATTAQAATDRADRVERELLELARRQADRPQQQAGAEWGGTPYTLP